MDAASVENFLAHYGVKGMKWGVRKSETSGEDKGPKLVLSEKLKSGETISIYEHPPSLLGKMITKMSGKPDQFKAFALRDKDGKKIGDASFRRKSQDELYLNWIGVRTKHRGKGYASAALRGAVKYAQSEGIKRLTLEVPGSSPDARHIYTKLGFKDYDNGQKINPNDIWGGLYPMALDVPQKNVKHAEMTPEEKWELEFAEEFGDFLIKHFSNLEIAHGQTEGESMEGDHVDDFLAHYGIKGMKWGVRKKKGPASADASRKQSVKDKAKEGGIQTLSNKDIQDAINRMRLEQDFKRLAVNEKPAVTRFVSSTLLEIGKREVQAQAGKQVAKFVAKKVVTGGLG